MSSLVLQRQEENLHHYFSFTVQLLILQHFCILALQQNQCETLSLSIPQLFLRQLLMSQGILIFCTLTFFLLQVSEAVNREGKKVSLQTASDHWCRKQQATPCRSICIISKFYQQMIIIQLIIFNCSLHQNNKY